MDQSAIRPQEMNPAKLGMLYKRQFQMSRVSAGETVCCISDLSTRREYIQASFAAADELGADAYEMCVNSIPGWTKVGVPTIGQCKGTLDAVLKADLIVIFHVPLFTRWLKDVLDAGVRVFSGHVMYPLWREIAGPLDAQFCKVCILRDPISHLASHIQWLDHYNLQRTHQGKMCCGRTPLTTLLEDKHLWDEKVDQLNQPESI